MKKQFLLIGFIAMTSAVFAQKSKLTVNVKGFENNKGKAFVAIFDTKEKQLKGLVESIVNQQVTVSFNDLVNGKYIVKVFHDLNENNKLDTGMFGIPKEPWGVSNNVRPTMSAPKPEDMIVEVKADRSITINVK